MNERRNRNDRRSEQRNVAAGRVFWNKVGRSLHHMGWLSDASRSSQSFVTAAGTRLTVGDEVDLKQPQDAPHRCQVARIAPYDSRLLLVACKDPRHSAGP